MAVAPTIKLPTKLFIPDVYYREVIPPEWYEEYHKLNGEEKDFTLAEFTDESESKNNDQSLYAASLPDGDNAHKRWCLGVGTRSTKENVVNYLKNNADILNIDKSSIDRCTGQGYVSFKFKPQSQ